MIKIIFLNSWFAKAGEPFFDFIKKEGESTDIFCLSEIHSNLNENLKKLLPSHNNYFYESGKEMFGWFYGQSIFVNKKFKSKHNGVFNIYNINKKNLGFAQQFFVYKNKKRINIINVHGKTRPGHKLDTPARLRQTKIILKHVSKHNEPTIIGGDFNLMPNTKSVGLFEESGFVNLIKKYNIKDTRGKINKEKHEGEETQYFADYCFVTPDIKVKSFKVPDLGISDHLPLILEFDI